MSFEGHALGRGLTLCRDAVGVFYRPNRQSDYLSVLLSIIYSVYVYVAIKTNRSNKRDKLLLCSFSAQNSRYLMSLLCPWIQLCSSTTPCRLGFENNPAASLQWSRTPSPTKPPAGRRWWPVMLEDRMLVAEQSMTFSGHVTQSDQLPFHVKPLLQYDCPDDILLVYLVSTPNTYLKGASKRQLRFSCAQTAVTWIHLTVENEWLILNRII